MELLGNITEMGKLTLFQPKELVKWLVDNRGNLVSLTITVKKKTRSNKQNAYYWGVVIPMVQEAMNEYGQDFSKDETHDYLKKEFNWVEVETKNGHYMKVPRSTSKLSTIEFMDYKEKIQQFGAQVLDIYIPDPNEALELDL